MIAQLLEALGLEYKYEPLIVIGGIERRPDFAVSSEIFNQRINYIRNHNISISTLTLNDNKKSVKSWNPSKYEISNAVDEQFINQNNNKEEKNQEQNISDEESLRMSLQSINDSKMLELANKYIDDGVIVDKSEINDILNDKTFQKVMKK